MRGDESAATIGQLLEFAKYASALARVALDAGAVPLEADPPPGHVDFELITDVAARTLANVSDELVALIPVESAEDIAFRQRAAEWARSALAAGLRGDRLPPLPVRTVGEPAEIVYPGAADDQRSDDVIDAAGG